MRQQLIDQIEHDLPVPARREKAAADLVALTLVDPGAAWPCLARWGGGDDSQAREAIANALAHLLEGHFDEVAPALARAAVQDDRFGNGVLPSCLRVMSPDRYQVFQKHLRAAMAITGREMLPEDSPSIEAILEEDDLDLFAIDLLDHLLGRDEMSEPESVALHLLMLNVEVADGGLEQYYLNSAGNQAGALPAALKAVGASRHAEIVEQANALFGAPGPSTEMAARRKQIGAFGAEAKQEWLRSSRAFSQLGGPDVKLVQRYARENRAAFGAA